MRKIGKFMTNKKVWPFLLSAIIVMVMIFAKSWGKEKSELTGKYEKI